MTRRAYAPRTLPNPKILGFGAKTLSQSPKSYETLHSIIEVINMRHHSIFTLGFVCLTLALGSAGCFSKDGEGETKTLDGGLKVEEVKIGDGAEAKEGS